MVNWPLSPLKFSLYFVHKSPRDCAIDGRGNPAGLAVDESRAPPPTTPYEQGLAYGAHMALYGVMIALPISGWTPSRLSPRWGEVGGGTLCVWRVYFTPLVASESELKSDCKRHSCASGMDVSVSRRHAHGRLAPSHRTQGRYFGKDAPSFQPKDRFL